MKRKLAVLGALALLALPLFAQEKTDNSMDYFGGLHKKGSQILSLTTGAELPLFLLPNDEQAVASPLYPGASFSLSYQYFFANRLTVGGSLTGAFNTTVGGRTLFLAPVALKLGYWWGKQPLELNAGLDLGASVLRLSGDGMITPFAKLGGGAFVQVSEAWSVGGQAYWWFIPEIHTGTFADYTRYGNFVEISLGALYHF